jgi:hypothetical protein
MDERLAYSHTTDDTHTADRDRETDTKTKTQKETETKRDLGRSNGDTYVDKIVVNNFVTLNPSYSSEAAKGKGPSSCTGIYTEGRKRAYRHSQWASPRAPAPRPSQRPT